MKMLNVSLLILMFFGLNAASMVHASDQSSNSHTHKSRIQGRIAGGRYYGAEDLFSIALPVKLNVSEIEDFYAAPNVGGVAFFNTSGFLLKLEIDEVVPEITHLATNHPEIKHEILDALFHELMIPQLKVLIPKAKILHEEKISLANGEQALFAVLNLPKAATLVDTQTGNNLDSMRGYLLFLSDGNKEIVNMNMQDTLTLIPNVAVAAKASLNERLLNHLMHYQSTFRAEPSILAIPKAL